MSSQHQTFTIIGELTEESGSPDKDVELSNGASTLQSQSTSYMSESESIGSSSEPRRFRSFADVYNHTEEVELDEEVLLMRIDEPRNYNQAARESNWRQAMELEMKSIE